MPGTVKRIAFGIKRGIRKVPTSPRLLQDSAYNFADLPGWTTPLARSLVRQTGFTPLRGIGVADAVRNCSIRLDNLLCQPFNAATRHRHVLRIQPIRG